MRYAFLLFMLISAAFAYAEDEVVYSFRTAKNKIMELRFDRVDSIFSYRFLSQGKAELQVTDDLTDSDTIFTVSGYHRGGGVQNAALDINHVRFMNKGYEYDIYYFWSAGEDENAEEPEPSFGILVSKNGKTIADIPGTAVITGGAYGWSFFDILPEDPSGAL